MGETPDQQSPASKPDTPDTGRPASGGVRWTHQQPPVKVRWTHQQPVRVKQTPQQPGSPPAAPAGPNLGGSAASAPGTPAYPNPGLPAVSAPGLPLPASSGPPAISLPDTRVTGRRIVQYILDSLFSSLPAGAITGVLTLAASLRIQLVGLAALVLWYLWYFVYRPYRVNGQTYGMQLLGVRVVSEDGGRAGMKQLFIRALFLIVDSFAFCLLGFFVIVLSRYRQRIGDHVAETLVVRADAGPMPVPSRER